MQAVGCTEIKHVTPDGLINPYNSLYQTSSCNEALRNKGHETELVRWKTSAGGIHTKGSLSFTSPPIRSRQTAKLPVWFVISDQSAPLSGLSPWLLLLSLACHRTSAHVPGEEREEREREERNDMSSLLSWEREV